MNVRHNLFIIYLVFWVAKLSSHTNKQKISSSRVNRITVVNLFKSRNCSLLFSVSEWTLLQFPSGPSSYVVKVGTRWPVWDRWTGGGLTSPPTLYICSNTYKPLTTKIVSDNLISLLTNNVCHTYPEKIRVPTYVSTYSVPKKWVHLVLGRE